MDLNLWTEPGKNPDGTPNKFKQAYKNMINKGHIAFRITVAKSGFAISI
jgi:hypothetical protein